jgi:hypothetical protein
MVSDLLYNATYWRHRAEEARAIGEAMHNRETRRIMFELAEDFGKLGERAEDRRKSIDGVEGSAPDVVWRVRSS